jgi:phenylacetate-CoA ligase
MIWNPQRECADKQQMQELQGSALQAMIRRIYNHVPFYRNRL